MRRQPLPRRKEPTLSVAAHALMAKRGRKPINFQQLDLWDAEWYLAFYRLCEGGELPLRTNQWWTRRQFNSGISERLAMVKKMTLEEYWAYFLLGERREPEWRVPPLSQNRQQAQKLRADDMADLTRLVDPTAIQHRQKGVEIWQALWQALSLPAVEKACRRWIAYGPDAAFPTHLLAHKKPFLVMKRDPRFPRSEFADDARLTYLAAGMAGILTGISPQTAIHRLRTMQHATGGPLWNDHEYVQRCQCWRCDRERDVKVFDAIVEAARKAERP